MWIAKPITYQKWNQLQRDNESKLALHHKQYIHYKEGKDPCLLLVMWSAYHTGLHNRLCNRLGITAEWQINLLHTTTIQIAGANYTEYFWYHSLPTFSKLLQEIMKIMNKRG